MIKFENNKFKNISSKLSTIDGLKTLNYLDSL